MGVAYAGLQKLLDGASALDASGSKDLRGAVQDLTILVEWGSGTGAGVVTIEEAAHSDYDGTWAVIDTLTWASASTTDAYHVHGAVAAIRARITTEVTGGTIDVYLVAR